MCKGPRVVVNRSTCSQRRGDDEGPYCAEQIQDEGSLCSRSEERMPTMSTLRNVGRHVILLIAIIVVLSAVAIWLGLGPVVN